MINIENPFNIKQASPPFSPLITCSNSERKTLEVTQKKSWHRLYGPPVTPRRRDSVRRGGERATN